MPSKTDTQPEAQEPAKLPCPYCRGGRSKVVNSRPWQQGAGIWRRRECIDCGRRFTTEEVVRGRYRETG